MSQNYTYLWNNYQSIDSFNHKLHIVRIFAFILALFFCIPIWGQFGVRVKFNNNNFSDFNNNQLTQDRSAFSGSLEIGLDYWLRMKNYRIEFLPEISYERNTEDIITGNKVTFSAISFFLNTNIYFMDFQGDCDCPTFSKEGGFVAKGLHLILSPGISKYSFKVNNFTEGEGNLNWNAGIGLGMDIGVNDLITATPFVLYRYRSGLKWDSLEEFVNNGDTDTSANQFQFGLRIGFRPDYQKPRFRN